MCGLASCETSFLVLVFIRRLTEDVYLIRLCQELWARIYTVTDHSFSTNNRQQQQQQQQRTPTTNFEEMRVTFHTTPTF